MRLTSIAAAILVVCLAGFSALKTAASGAPASPAAPQQSDSSAQQPLSSQTLQVQTSLVNVFATVRDKHNSIISDLTKDDFKIFEDGQEQKVAYFAKEVDMPITLGMLIDTSGSMENLIDAEHDAATRFLKTVMRPKDEAMVISFDLDADLLADFTEDLSVLDRAIRRTSINTAGGLGPVTPGTIPNNNVGGTILYDAIYLACHDELGSEAGRKAVVIITDAEDEGSKVQLKDAIESAQRADAVIHVLLLADTGGFFARSMGYSGASVAQQMSSDTGGRTIDVHNEKSLETAFDQISEELRSQYVLGYYPSNAKRDGTFRKIKVETGRTDTKILARKGYYAPNR
jgi:VWFA-related protein